MSNIVRLAEFRHRRGRVYFNRSELSRLLQVYSERVAQGEWRDYAIDHTVGMAVFSVFRHAHDQPLYAVAKIAGAQKNIDYAVFDQKRRLKRATDLDAVLRVFDGSISAVD